MEKINSVQLLTVNNQVVVSSLDVAKAFGKRHDNVLRDIQNITLESNALKSEVVEFNRLNFESVDYIDKKGQLRKMYHLTKNGFVLLVMGYTSEKAMQLKIAYINQFDAMEKFIRENHFDGTAWRKSRLEGKRARRNLTYTIKDALIPAAIAMGSKNYAKFYMVYTKMLNDLYIDDASIDVGRGHTLRDYMDVCELSILKRIESIMAEVILREIAAGTHYKTIYQLTKAKVDGVVAAIGRAHPVLPDKQTLTLVASNGQ